METKTEVIETYLKTLASREPVPGGGGASALAGALGAALAGMVCNLTLGKKKYANVEKNIALILEEMQEHIQSFLQLADQDAAVFAPLAKAYSLPASTAEEKQKKEEIMEELLWDAAQVPFSIMREGVWMLQSVCYLARYGSRMAVSDAGVSISLLRASITGAMMNVAVNAGMMKDKTRARKLLDEASDMLEASKQEADKLYTEILEELL